MREEYIRIVIETGHREDDELFVVHAFKEEEQGAATTLDRLLARVIVRLERPLQLRTLAGVITCLDHAAAVPVSPNSTVAEAELNLVAAARQLLRRWALVVDDAVEKDEDESPVATSE